MSFKITEPGFYKQRDGGKAEIFTQRNGVWFGRDSNGNPCSWGPYGTDYVNGTNTGNLVSVWMDEVPVPVPPAGFQIMPDDYVATYADMLWQSHKGVWEVVTGVHGMWKTLIDKAYTKCAPVWIAAPIPVFKVSDKGPGVYRTRDGIQFSIVDNDSGYYTSECPWADINNDHCWYDNGYYRKSHQAPMDLVEYVGPLSPSSEWVPTSTIRCYVEQRWEKDGVSEWRTVVDTDTNT